MGGIVARIAFALAAALALPAMAQDFPNRPVTMLVPYAAGGPGDLIARVIHMEMAQRMGQAVVIELKPGAGGNIGAEIVAKNVKPDGYTVLKASTSLASNPVLQKKFPFDHQTDLIPVAGINIVPMSVVVSPAVPVKTLADFVDWAKKKQGGVTYGSAGPGTTSHLAGALFGAIAGIEVLHVPFKGVAPAQAALLGGQLEGMFDFVSSMAPQVRAGKLRALAVASRERLPSLPDVPTSAEAGYPAYDVAGWFGLFAPKGTPREIVMKWNDATNFALDHPDVKKRFADRGEIALRGSPEDFGKFYRGEVERWRKLVAAGRLQQID